MNRSNQSESIDTNSINANCYTDTGGIVSRASSSLPPASMPSAGASPVVSSASVPDALNPNVNAEILRMMLGRSIQAGSPLLSALSASSTMGAEIMGILQQPPSAQLPINNVAAHSSMHGLQTTAQLSPEEQYVLSMMLSQSDRMPTSIGQQLSLSIQTQPAQHIISTAVSMNAASRYPLNVLSESSLSHPSYLEHLLHLSQRHRERVTLPNTLLQAHEGLQAQAGGLIVGNFGLGLAAFLPPSGLPRVNPIPTPSPRSYDRQWKTESFPVKLYRILAEAERQGNIHIISFTPDGRAFKIHDQSTFMDQASPKFFRQTCFSSFVRQLNFYGFERLSHGPDRGAFAHPSFLRGRPELVRNVQRQILAPRAKKSE
jgi:hypothetical protein